MFPHRVAAAYYGYLVDPDELDEMLDDYVVVPKPVVPVSAASPCGHVDPISGAVCTRGVHPHDGTHSDATDVLTVFQWRGGDPAPIHIV